MKIIEWIKKNIFLTIVLLVVAYFLLSVYKSLFGVNILNLDIPQDSKNYNQYSEGVSLAPGAAFSALSDVSLSTTTSRTQNYAPQKEIDNRLVIQESNMSLLVKDVTGVRNKIVEHAQGSGGYMVSSNVSNPQDNPTATVVVRVPSDKLEDTLNFYRSLSVKVVSENLLGRDVTDQYIDIDTHIAQLERAKSRLETILDSAEKIADITSLTQQIISYQNQIDSYKGQQDALEKNAQLAKLTLYLSTDEIALPYAPSETFRPEVIFKLAVRSLVKTLRGLATIGIWVGVYAVVWVPVLATYIFLKKWLKKRKAQSKQETAS